MWTLGPDIPDLGPWHSRTLLNTSEEWKKIKWKIKDKNKIEMRFKNILKIIFMRKNWNFDDSEYGGKKKIKIKKEKKRKENEKNM